MAAADGSRCPLSVAALRYGTPLACLAFAGLTITPTWISLGYFLPLVVAAGIAAERRVAAGPLPLRRKAQSARE